MDGNYSLADIAAATGGEGLGGANGGMWIFALLILLAIGNGGFLGGGKSGDRNASVGDIQRSQDFAAIERQLNEGVATTRQGVYDTTGAIKDGNYNILGELRNLQTVSTTGFSNMQNCCCETNRNIDSVKFDMANYSAAIQANNTANTQKVLDALNQSKVEAMQNQINHLQLQQALCGVPKVSPYGYGMYPTFQPMPFGVQ